MIIPKTLNTLYLNENKKETDAWFQALGAQMPLLGGTKYGLAHIVLHPDFCCQANFSARVASAVGSRPEKICLTSSTGCDTLSTESSALVTPETGELTWACKVPGVLDSLLLCFGF